MNFIKRTNQLISQLISLASMENLKILKEKAIELYKILLFLVFIPVVLFAITRYLLTDFARREIVIQINSNWAELEERGYNAVAIADQIEYSTYRIYERTQFFHDTESRTAIRRALSHNRSHVPSLTLPETGLSFRDLNILIKDSLGLIDRYSISIIKLGDTYTLTAVTDSVHPYRASFNSVDDIGKNLEKVAAFIVRKEDPQVWMQYEVFYGDIKPLELAVFTNDYLTNNDSNDDYLAFTLTAFFWAKNGQSDLALMLLEEVASDSNYNWNDKQKSHFFGAMGELLILRDYKNPDAKPILERAVAFNSDNSRAYKNLLQLNNYLEHVDDNVELQTNAPNSLKLDSGYLVNLARLRHQQGNEEAALHFHIRYWVQTAVPYGLLDIGETYSRLHDCAKKQVAFEAAKAITASQGWRDFYNTENVKNQVDSFNEKEPCTIPK